MRPASPDRLDAIVIGAGQAGLATAYHLARNGRRFAVLERDERVGDVWRRRWDSLRLYSPAKYDSLPGLPFPADAWHYPTGRQMADYLETYAATLELPVRTGVAVTGLRAAPGGDGFVVELVGGERLEADQVVVASGAFQVPTVPPFAGRLDPSIRQIHSSEYRRPDQLADGPVLVVGASHSGADLALEAARAGHETILAGIAAGQLPIAVIDTWRARLGLPVANLLFRRVLTRGTPIGRKQMPRVRHGGGPLLRVRRPDLQKAGVDWVEERVAGVRDGRPVLAGGRVVEAATVLWCTGFRRDDAWIDLPIGGEDGYPREYRGVVEDVPGLYTVGVPFQWSFASMLVNGAGRDAAYVAERIEARARELAAGHVAAPADRTPASVASTPAVSLAAAELSPERRAAPRR